MKTKLTLIILTIFLSSCLPIDKKALEKQVIHNRIEDLKSTIVVFDYDGCEYLTSGSGQTATLTHKGNCKYCIQREISLYKIIINQLN